jgi:hypothetical protein
MMIATRITTMVITVSNSTKVKPVRERSLRVMG